MLESHFTFAVLYLQLSPNIFWDLTFHELYLLSEAYNKKLEYEQYCAGLTPALLYNIHKNKSAKSKDPLDFFRPKSHAGGIKIRDSETLKNVLAPLFNKG